MCVGVEHKGEAHAGGAMPREGGERLMGRWYVNVTEPQPRTAVRAGGVRIMAAAVWRAVPTGGGRHPKNQAGVPSPHGSQFPATAAYPAAAGHTRGVCLTARPPVAAAVLPAAAAVVVRPPPRQARRWWWRRRRRQWRQWRPRRRWRPRRLGCTHCQQAPAAAGRGATGPPWRGRTTAPTPTRPPWSARTPAWQRREPLRGGGGGGRGGGKGGGHAPQRAAPRGHGAARGAAGGGAGSEERAEGSVAISGGARKRRRYHRCGHRRQCHRVVGPGRR